MLQIFGDLALFLCRALDQSFAATFFETNGFALVACHIQLGVALQLVSKSGFSALVFEFVLCDFAVSVFCHVDILHG